MTIQFVLNDQIVFAINNGTETLLDYIRYKAHLKGTKIGCREGDCGACTVLVGSLEDEKIYYKNIISCLTPLANVHGKHVVTVEGINESGLNLVQKAIVANSGTQCGFCTPGFVMSLCSFVLNNNEPELSVAISSMDGNICRCTGYKSLERAANSIINDLQVLDKTSWMDSLIQAEFIPPYFKSIHQKLSVITPLSHSKDNLVIAGGTDLYVKYADELSEMPLNYLSANSKEENIAIINNLCICKATCTVTELMENPEIAGIIPGWYHYLKLVSSTPIRNIATIGGNLVNASPIGDLTIILLALNSKITLSGIQKQRQIPLDEFYKGYKLLNKQTDEIISHITFPIPDSLFKFNFEKVSKRMYLDIASVNTSISIQNEDKKIIHIRCSIGGVGPIPMFLTATSNFLKSKQITPDIILQAEKILQTEISPISDARGQKEYKRLLAKQLFFSHFITLYPQFIKMEDLI